MPSHTDGVTTAPASISSSAHAARVKCSSLNASPLSPNDPVADPNNVSPDSSRHASKAGYSAQELCQPFDVVVVNGALGFGPCPLQTVARAFEHFFSKVLPAREPVLAREHQLGVTLRQRQFSARQLRTRSRDRVGIPGGNVAGEFLRLLAEGF